MPKTKKKTVSEHDSVETPLYTPWDVARYLRVPLWAVAAMTGRLRGWPELKYIFRHVGWDLPHPVFVDDDLLFPPGFSEERLRISFRRFAGLFVRVGVLHALAVSSQGGQKRLDRWERLHRVAWGRLEDMPPITFHAPLADQVVALAGPFVEGLDEDQAEFIKRSLALRLDRVELENGVPIRVYPPTRDPAEKSPRTIVLDPRIRFGRPTVAGRGIPTDSLFERFLAGDSGPVLARDYELTSSQVEEAIRFESRLPVPLFPYYGW